MKEKFYDMKEKFYGRSSIEECSDLTSIDCVFDSHLAGFVAEALKSYRSNREFGEVIDNPERSFPSGEFEQLNIKVSSKRSSNHWPDIKQRYWWKLTLIDETINVNWYWMKDEKRGWPDENGNYWFIIFDSNDIELEGFSQRFDRALGTTKEWASTELAKEANIFSRILAIQQARKGHRFIGYRPYRSINEWMKEKESRFIDRFIRENEIKSTHPFFKHDLKRSLRRLQRIKKDDSHPYGISNYFYVETSLAQKKDDNDSSAEQLLSDNLGDSLSSSQLDLAPNIVQGFKDYAQKIAGLFYGFNGKIRRDDIPFPFSGFERMDIRYCESKGPDYWPDHEGRYWWKLTLEDGSTTEEWYWIKDKKRGWPDENIKNRYWFIIGGPHGTEIDGFSYLPEKENFIDNSVNKAKYSYRYCVQYNEGENIKEWVKERSYYYMMQSLNKKHTKNEQAMQDLVEQIQDNNKALLNITINKDSPLVGGIQIKALAEAILKNNTIISLLIKPLKKYNHKYINIGADALCVLFQGLVRNHTLTSLIIEDRSEISKEACELLAEIIKHNRSLMLIKLCGPISNAEVKILANTLKENNTLQSLSICVTDQSKASAKFSEALKFNYMLTSLEIESYAPRKKYDEPRPMGSYSMSFGFYKPEEKTKDQKYIEQKLQENKKEQQNLWKRCSRATSSFFREYPYVTTIGLGVATAAVYLVTSEISNQLSDQSSEQFSTGLY